MWGAVFQQRCRFLHLLKDDFGELLTMCEQQDYMRAMLNKGTYAKSTVSYRMKMKG